MCIWIVERVPVKGMLAGMNLLKPGMNLSKPGMNLSKPGMNLSKPGEKHNNHVIKIYNNTPPMDVFVFGPSLRTPE